MAKQKAEDMLSGEKPLPISRRQHSGNTVIHNWITEEHRFQWRNTCTNYYHRRQSVQFFTCTL